MWETWVQSLGREDLLEKEMATHSSILAWKIPWMEEPGRLQSMGLQKGGHDWATSLSLSIWMWKLDIKENWVPKNVQSTTQLHSSHTLAWKIPWTEEPARLQSMGPLRVRHEWATSLLLFTFLHWRRKWQPTLVLLPGKFYGQRKLVGYSPWGCKKLDTTERLHFSFFL